MILFCSSLLTFEENMETNDTVKNVFGLIEKKTVLVCVCVSFIALLLSVISIINSTNNFEPIEEVVQSPSDEVMQRLIDNMDGMLEVMTEMATNIENNAIENIKLKQQLKEQEELVASAKETMLNIQKSLDTKGK